MFCNIRNLLAEAVAIRGSVCSRKQRILCIESTSAVCALPYKSSGQIKAQRTNFTYVIWCPYIRVLWGRRRCDLVCQEVCETVKLGLDGPSTGNATIEVNADICQPGILGTKLRIAVAYIV